MHGSNFSRCWNRSKIEKVGHDLKFDLSVLRWHGMSSAGKAVRYDDGSQPDRAGHAAQHWIIVRSLSGLQPGPISKLPAEAKAEQTQPRRRGVPKIRGIRALKMPMSPGNCAPCWNRC